MILFYEKETGKVFSAMDGRVHGEEHLRCKVSNGLPDEKIGKYIIGFVKKGEQSIEYNMDKFKLLQEFESVSAVSPLDYRVDTETGELVKIH